MQLAREDLLTAYRTMALIRVFEERVQREMSSGDIPGSTHLYAGQEASAVGISMHLGDMDRVASTHRGHGHSIAKGCDVDGMMAEIFGRATGICHGKGGSMHIADMGLGHLGANAIVGGGIPHVVGAGISYRNAGSGAISVAFFGDGAMSQGILYESMTMPALWHLPVVVCCINTPYGMGRRVDRLTALLPEGARA